MSRRCRAWRWKSRCSRAASGCASSARTWNTIQRASARPRPTPARLARRGLRPRPPARSQRIDPGPLHAGGRPSEAVLCGDFNSKPSDIAYRRTLEPFDDGTTPWRDAWLLRHPGQPHAPTCGMYDKEQWPEPPFACDFVFVTENLAGQVSRCEVNAATKDSDHQHRAVIGYLNREGLATARGRPLPQSSSSSSGVSRFSRNAWRYSIHCSPGSSARDSCTSSISRSNSRGVTPPRMSWKRQYIR